MKLNVKFLLSVMTTFVVLGFAKLAFAADDAAATAAANAKAMAIAGNSGFIAFAAAIGLGIAALGGALAQGRAAATALDGIARNPGAAEKIQGPMILGLALIESLVIYSLIIAFILVGKI